MLAYNLTMRIEPQWENQWKDWMRANFIPQVMRTGHFLSVDFAKITRPLLDDQKTYSVQLRCSAQKDLDDFLGGEAIVLQGEQEALFGGNYVSFSSVMEFIEL